VEPAAEGRGTLDDQLVEQLVDRARAEGLNLADAGGCCSSSRRGFSMAGACHVIVEVKPMDQSATSIAGRVDELGPAWPGAVGVRVLAWSGSAEQGAWLGGSGNGCVR
jgi:hypothetical protein